MEQKIIEKEEKVTEINQPEQSTRGLLKKNQPNPFNENTTIGYFLPSDIENAKLYIYDLQGKQIKSIEVTQRENGQLVIHGYELQAGIYYYSLIVDGLVIGTEQMIQQIKIFAMKKEIFFFILFMTITLSSVSSQIFNHLTIIRSDTISFESINSIILIDTSLNSNLWQIGMPAKPIINSPSDGFKVIITDTTNSYDTNNYSIFTFTIPNQEGAWHELIFWHWYDTEVSTDGGYLEVSYDMGENWHNVIDWESNYTWGIVSFENFYSNSSQLIDNKYGFSGSSNGWIKSSISWEGFEPIKSETFSQNMVISPVFDSTLVRYIFLSDSNDYSGDGWAIDNIISIIYDFPSAIDKPNSSEKFNIFPNPFIDIINIEGSMLYDRIEIFDFTGRKIIEIPNHPEQIALHGIVPGIYALHFFNKKILIYSEKLVKSALP